MDNQDPELAFSHVFRVADLPSRKSTRFDLTPDAEALAAIAQYLDILDLRKLRFTGMLSPAGKRDWRLEAKLGATVVQPCVLTTDPVTTRIEETVTRLYTGTAKYPTTEEEMEMPEDDSVEVLGEKIDVGDVMVEALALALPLYPRATDAELGTAVFTEPGKTPMRDEETRPFAGLAALRDKLDKDDGSTD